MDVHVELAALKAKVKEVCYVLGVSHKKDLLYAAQDVVARLGHKTEMNEYLQKSVVSLQGKLKVARDATPKFKNLQKAAKRPGVLTHPPLSVNHARKMARMKKDAGAE